ncbi:MAG: helix-turn-helix domain-containing protein [Bacteroidetes bacterium]|nr:helix-turn-helix domain-containing protein [Bacteroidota bacterium]
MTQAFEIIKLTPELSRKYADMPSKPHRHDYEEIIIVSKGNPQHFIDFNKETITPPIVIYVAQGKIHQFLPDTKTEGWAIRYKTEFIPESRFHFYSNFLDNINYPFESAECTSKLDTMCALMLDEYKLAHPDFIMIKHLLLALLSKLEQEGKNRFRQESNSNNTQLISFNNFLKIVEANYKRPEGVEFYADKMNMSVRNLNLICHSIFNMSVSEIVETRKLIEARQLLLNTDLSISEIGYELGYNEKAYFTRVFSKKTGLTPTEFRNQMSALIS